MAAIFSSVSRGSRDLVESVNEKLDDVGDILNGAIEGTQSFFENAEKDVRQMFAIESICNYMESHKVGSMPYFYALESCSKVLRELTSGDQIPFVVPSMEDFKNPGALTDCHNFAMEGWRERVLDLYRRFKKFLKELAMRFTLVFRRLLKLDLQLEEYEAYVEKMISDVKHRTTKILIPEMIDTKLPQMLSIEGTNFDADNLCREGVDRIHDFLKIYDDLNSSTGGFVTAISQLNNDLASLEAKTRNLIASEAGSIEDPAVRLSVTEKIAQELGSDRIPGLQAVFTATITNIFGFSTLSSSDTVPDKVRTIELNVRGEGAPRIWRAFSSVESMPNNFSLYLLLSESGDTPLWEVVSINELNKDTPAKLQTLTNPSNLTSLYGVYKNLAKVKPDKLAKQFDRVTTEIDKLVGCAERLEKLFPEAVRFRGGKDLIRFVNAVNIMAKETTFGASQVLSMLRFELIRYIFKSCENLKPAD